MAVLSFGEAVSDEESIFDVAIQCASGKEDFGLPVDTSEVLECFFEEFVFEDDAFRTGYGRIKTDFESGYTLGLSLVWIAVDDATTILTDEDLDARDFSDDIREFDRWVKGLVCAPNVVALREGRKDCKTVVSCVALGRTTVLVDR